MKSLLVLVGFGAIFAVAYGDVCGDGQVTFSFVDCIFSKLNSV